MTIEIKGLNLERLLREAQENGIFLRDVRRISERNLSVRVNARQRAALSALCMRFGWEMKETSADILLSLVRCIRRRLSLAAGAALCLALVWLSGHVVLETRIVGAKEYEAEVRRFLDEEGAKACALKRSLSLDELREGMLLRLPGVSHAGLRYAGSRLIVECHLARSGESLAIEGTGRDLVAREAGVVTKMVVSSGTPAVNIGDAVHAGQVLVRGEERAQKGGVTAVMAQAQVLARVWAEGKASASLFTERTEETGRTRERVFLTLPGYKRLIRDAQAFDKQEISVNAEKVIDLFIPLERRTEIFREIRIIKTPRSKTDAVSLAQGAAEKLAKEELPANALILDKWVNYSMIDNEFVYASVVLEYERDVAVRAEAPFASAQRTEFAIAH